MEIRVETPQPHIALVTIANEPRRNAMNRAMPAGLGPVGLSGGTSGTCTSGVPAVRSRTQRNANASATSAPSPAIHHETMSPTMRTTTPTELLLSTDIRAAVPEARFGLPEVRWSIYPFGGATVKLAHQIGHVHAMDLLLTGRLVDAAFAERIGLVNRIVERDRLMPWALETAAAIAANSPSAVQAVRTQISSSIADYAKSREALEQQLGDRVRTGPHFAEGVAAFREKRKPDYR